LVETSIPLAGSNAHDFEEECKKRSLKPVRNYSNFLIYHYGWKKASSKSRVERACRKLKKFPFVKACEGDASINPSTTETIEDPFRLDDVGPDRFKTPAECQIGPQAPSNVPPNRARGLSSFWAQEYTGSDLAREFVSGERTGSDLVFALDNEPRIEHYPDVHLIHVISLLQGPEVASVLPSGVGTVRSQNGGRNDLALIDIVHDLWHHRIVSNSMNWADSPMIGDALLKLGTEGTIVVTETEHEEQKEDAGSRGAIILADAVKPYGAFRDLREVSTATSISAPSDEFVLLSGAKNGAIYAHFTGAGGAVPIVAGSLADFEAITGYRLTPMEAKTLLAATAIPKVDDSSSGIVNTYKIALVAEKIRSTCGRGRDSCIHGTFPTMSSTSFEVDSRAVKAARSVFPWCFSNSDPGSSKPKGSCSEQQTAITAIRRAALTAPQRGDLWYALGCAYASEGLSQNASYYYSVANATGNSNGYTRAVQALSAQGLYGQAANFVYSTPYQGKSMAEKIEDLQLEAGVRRHLFQALAFKSDGGSSARTQAILLGLKDEDPSVRVAAIQAAKLDEKSISALKDLYSAERTPATRSLIIKKVCRLQSDDAKAILKQAIDESGPDAQYVKKNCMVASTPVAAKVAPPPKQEAKHESQVEADEEE
jgi:hypothetical protein